MLPALPALPAPCSLMACFVPQCRRGLGGVKLQLSPELGLFSHCQPPEPPPPASGHLLLDSRVFLNLYTQRRVGMNFTSAGDSS